MFIWSDNVLLRQCFAKYACLAYDHQSKHPHHTQVDLFGNYLCQKLIAFANEAQRFMLLSKIKDDLLRIACDRQGTRAVQKLMQVMTLITL
jgi:hypothetical protein